MRGGKFRSLIAGLAFTAMMCTDLPAGHIAEAIGKGWDKAAGKIVKIHKAAKPLKPSGKHIKGAMARLKPAGAGCCCGK